MEVLKNLFKIGVVLYLLSLVILYFIQEKLIFHPTTIPKSQAFQSPYNFEEVNINVAEGIDLNALHFKAENSKGVVLFFHGNGGAIRNWAKGAYLYLENNYDVFYVDYRGYGKSDGKIISEAQFVEDGQKAYDYLKESYKESSIIIQAISIGTGVATQLAVNNKPKHLILMAPYFSLKSLVMKMVKIVPPFILRYKLESGTYLKNAKFPITIFHGEQDQLIPVSHAQQLKSINANIDLHVLKGVGHNTIPSNQTYQKEMTIILGK